MDMTPEDLHFLFSAAGRHWLQSVAEAGITPQNHLQIASRLRKNLPPTQAQAVIEIVRLRQRAAGKFSRAAEMFFTRAALEQATAEAVARHRAARFADLEYRQIVDLGCGIGGDALALAEFASVTGVDWDPVRIQMAQQNLHVYGVNGRFHGLIADILELSALPADAVFFDPARRDEHGRRFFSVHDYQPPLAAITPWLNRVRGAAVKISPGVDYAELPAEAEVEFISLDGEVKEATLWYGECRGAAPRRATLLPAGISTDHGRFTGGASAGHAAASLSLRAGRSGDSRASGAGGGGADRRRANGSGDRLSDGGDGR
jgi:SAM-dependent methyltransferase